MDYVAIQLAIRDREKLIEVFCHRQPDLTTTSIRELVRVYDPIIRALHNAVDLASGVSDAQAFVDDLIKLSLIDKSKVGKIPTVQDFVRLLQTHQGSSHVFIHQVLKNGKELSQWYHEYACQAIQQYKQENNFPLSASHVAAAGDLTALLEELVSELSEGERCMVVGELNFHAACLQNLAPESRRSVRLIVEAPLTPGRGNSWADDKAGIFLHKWQHFIDETKITPGPEDGPPRTGKSDSVKDATAAEIDGSKPAVSAPEPSTMKRPVIFPNVSKVLCLLAPGFKDALRRRVNVKKRESGSEAITE